MAHTSHNLCRKRLLMLLNDVYLRAKYYDIVFDRDITQHIDFCLALFKHLTDRKPMSVLDIACGPGYHARAFAQRGLTSYGLDLSSDMVAYASEQAPRVTFIEADMRDFALEKPVDLAVCVFDGVDLLNSTVNVVQHLEAVSHALRPGGVYIIEQTHPRDANLYHLPPLTWAGSRGGIDVEFVWGVNHPQPDITSGVAEIQMEMRINDHGQRQIIHDTSIERTLTPQELAILTQYVVPDLQIVDYYGGFDLKQPLDWSDNASHMITVLQKQ